MARMIGRLELDNEEQRQVEAWLKMAVETGGFRLSEKVRFLPG